VPVATAGTVSMIGDRLAGWWLASVIATVAVLLLSPPSPGDRLRAAAAGLARELAARLDASASGTPAIRLPHLLWVEECLKHPSSHAQAITGPAWDMARQRRSPGGGREGPSRVPASRVRRIPASR
jgi:hypothetical protein